MSEKKHVGLKIETSQALTSIELDSGHKYRRYFTIAFLPAKGSLPSCLCVGNLEQSLDEEKEFYNPAKFYRHEQLWRALVNMLAAYIAFTSIKTGRPLHSIFNAVLNDLYGSKLFRLKLQKLAEAYYNSMRKLEQGVS